MEQVGAQDILDVVLINAGDTVQKGAEGRLVMEKTDDMRLVMGGYLRIRNNERGEEGVCPVAFTAAETADAQPDKAVRSFEAAQIIAMDGQAGTMPACTYELVKLEGRKGIVVNFLC